MPTPSSASSSPASRQQQPEDLLLRLKSTDANEKLQALREVKNQIIGNRTKKLSYLGAVPAVVSALEFAMDDCSDLSLILQSAAAVGSFACGFDTGVKAVLDAGAFPVLVRLLEHPDDKVVDAGARSLKMIYQSNVAPKYEFTTGETGSLLALLNSENENLIGLGLSIIANSCKTSIDQKTLCKAGVMKKITDILHGSISLKDTCIESLSTLIRANTEVIAQLMTPAYERSFNYIIELINDKSRRTRVLACSFLTVLRNADPTHLPDEKLKNKLVRVLLDLVDDADQVGEDALFVLSELLVNEDMQRLAHELNAVSKFCSHLSVDSLSARRLSQILLVLAELCSVLESGRSKLFFAQLPLTRITDALTDDTPEVRVAACLCLKSLSRSVQFVSAGHLMTKKRIESLVHLLRDESHSVQIASFGAVSNIVVDFSPQKSVFIEFGGLDQLIEFSKAMNTELKVNAVRALRNLMFHADNKCKEKVFSDLTIHLIESLINDAEPAVQEQALAMVRNLVDGSVSNIDFVFAGDCVLLNAVTRQQQNAGAIEVQIQVMCVLCNIASGTELHKNTVMHKVAPVAMSPKSSITIKFLRSADRRLRLATIWTIVNLMHPWSPDARKRVEGLRIAGIIPQIEAMINDPCLDVKIRAKTTVDALSAVRYGPVID